MFKHEFSVIVLANRSKDQTPLYLSTKLNVTQSLKLLKDIIYRQLNGVTCLCRTVMLWGSNHSIRLGTLSPLANDII